MGCWAAKGLIAFCIGYLPQHGSSVAVKQSCVMSYPQAVRNAARRCADEHDITYRIVRDR
jgi:hypothetical protein